MPKQSERAWDVEVLAAVGRVGEAAGRELQSRARSATVNLLERLPRADRIYLEQMMYATYCSSIRDNPRLSDTEREARLQAYNREVRGAVHGSLVPRAPATDPRAVARAELAAIPVDYTPGRVRAGGCRRQA
jgi:hypothetical protein